MNKKSSNIFDKLNEKEIIKKFKEHKLKYTLSIILILGLIIGIFLGLLYLNEVAILNEKIIGPTTEKIELAQGIFYTGDIENGKIQGNGKLTIGTSSYIMTLEGLFDKVNKESKNIEIGNFLNGTIKLEDYSNGNKYIWSGNFKNFTLLNGSLKIVKGDKYIEYKGSFNKNKLQGIGTKVVNVKGKMQETTGWFENGVLKEE